MHLQPGCRFCVAPRFHSVPEWSARLQLNSGSDVSEGGWRPRQDWRAAEADELAALLAVASPLDDSADNQIAPDSAGIFNVPQHLRAGIWSDADATDVSMGDPSHFQTFVVAMSDFLHFKRLPLPPRCRFDLIASRPGQLSTRRDAPGVRFDESARTLAIINLGDEQTHVTMVNLPWATVAALPEDADVKQASLRDLSARFYATHPDYPVVRVRLDAGDGLWLPEHHVMWDGDTQGKLEIDLVLHVGAEYR